jgi:hypothetical protein
MSTQGKQGDVRTHPFRRNLPSTPQNFTVEYTYTTKFTCVFHSPPLDRSWFFFIQSFPFLMPIRRSCRLHSCWFIVINVESESTAKKYHLIMIWWIVNGHWRQRMPQYTSTVLEALNNKGIICSFCAETVLEHIERMATNYCTSHLLAMYDSKESFVDHLIEVVCCCYIHWTVNQGENRLELPRGRFTHLLDLCKKAAKKKRVKRRHDEIYLGILSFPSELNRSFNELIAIVVDMFG